MFQTDPNHYLQSFDHQAIILLMQAISSLGTTPVLIFIVVTLMFGFNYRKGFAALQILLWTVIMTTFLKNWFNLPRPLDVDNGLKIYGETYNQANLKFHAKDAPGFFEPLPEDVLDFYDKNKLNSNGFPSGHVSMATAFWTSVYMLYQSKWLFYTAFVFIFLMPFSRMFLGQHFLADVLGGFFLGLIAVLIAYPLVLSPKAQKRLQELKKMNLKKIKEWGIWLLYLLLCPLLISLSPYTEITLPATLLGINTAFLITFLKGLPENNPLWYTGIFRVLATLGIYIIFDQLFKQFPVESNQYLLTFMMITIKNTLTWWFAVEINYFFGWFKRLNNNF